RSSSKSTGNISLGSNRCLLWKSHIADAWMRRNQVSYLIFSIIYNDQFFVWIILPLEVGQRLAYECSPVARGHDAGDQGRRFRLLYRSSWLMLLYGSNDNLRLGRFQCLQLYLNKFARREMFTLFPPAMQFIVH